MAFIFFEMQEKLVTKITRNDMRVILYTPDWIRITITTGFTGTLLGRHARFQFLQRWKDDRLIQGTTRSYN